MANLSSIGTLGAKTCSIYALDPTGTVPLEPLADLIPGFGPNRVTFDAIEADSYVESFRVTQNTMQDLTDTTSHVQADLRALSVTGVFAAAGVYGSAIPGAPTTGLVRLGRFDLVRYENLKRIARAGRPVMVATPRHSLARAFITSIPSNWTPADGDSLPVTITFLEARVARSGTISAYADVESMATGNNSNGTGSSGGASSVSESVSPAQQGVPPMAPF